MIPNNNCDRMQINKDTLHYSDTVNCFQWVNRSVWVDGRYGGGGGVGIKTNNYKYYKHTVIIII